MVSSRQLIRTPPGFTSLIQDCRQAEGTRLFPDARHETAISASAGRTGSTARCLWSHPPNVFKEPAFSFYGNQDFLGVILKSLTLIWLQRFYREIDLYIGYSWLPCRPWGGGCSGSLQTGSCWLRSVHYRTLQTRGPSSWGSLGPRVAQLSGRRPKMHLPWCQGGQFSQKPRTHELTKSPGSSWKCSSI